MTSNKERQINYFLECYTLVKNWNIFRLVAESTPTLPTLEMVKDKDRSADKDGSRYANKDCSADMDDSPTWVTHIPFKEGTLSPAERALWGDSIQISSAHTPASLRAQREFMDAVAKATPIVVPVDIDYKECLAFALELEAERALEKSMETLTIKDSTAAKPKEPVAKPKDLAKPKKKKHVPPPPFTAEQLRKFEKM